MKRQWLYKGDVNTGKIFCDDEIQAALADGWTDEPGKEPEQKSVDEMDKAELEAYAKLKFGVDLDKRRTLENLAAQVKALEDDNGT